MDRRVCFYRKITTHEITLLYPLTMPDKLRKHNTQKRSELLHFQHVVFHCQLSLSIHTSANSGGDDTLLRNSSIVRYNSGIGGHSKNSYFAQDNSGIVPILTLRRTYNYSPLRLIAIQLST